MVISPYRETQIDDDTIIREFSPKVNEEDLVWHRDHRSRNIEVLEGGNWKFQKDDLLPEIMESGDVIFVEKMTYHRLIRGDGNLHIKITEV